MLQKYTPYLIIAVLIIGFLVYNQQKDKREAAQSGPYIEQQQAFLIGNKAKEGITTTASGLQYQILVPGDGVTFPTATDKVKVHYRGTLIDGTEFDSSYARNQPISFGLKQVIAGWTEGLQLMSVGSKAKLYIPAELAYGSRKAGSIPANSTLVFEVELLGIE